MPTADYSSYHQPSGTGGDGTKFDNFIDAVQATVNGLDNNNIVNGAAIDLTTKAAAAATAYTPAWTSSGTAPAVGNGTLTGRYIQIGKLVFATIHFVAGTTTTFGSGAFFFSLPVTAQAATGLSSGNAHVLDSSAASEYFAFLKGESTTVLSLWTVGSPATFMTATVPFTFASADTIDIRMTYEAA